MPLGREIGLGPGDIVLDGDPAAPPKGGTAASHFLLHAYCSQTARWIKMPLGMELGLRPGHIVLDGNPAPPKRGTTPNFGPRLLWPNGWMDQDATWYGGKPRLRPHCYMGTQLPQGAQSPNFRPMPVVAKRLDGSRCHLVRM